MQLFVIVRERVMAPFAPLMPRVTPPGTVKEPLPERVPPHHVPAVLTVKPPLPVSVPAFRLKMPIEEVPFSASVAPEALRVPAPPSVLMLELPAENVAVAPLATVALPK